MSGTTSNSFSTIGYPNLLAGGAVAEGVFSPFQLMAGESDIVTGQGTAGAVALEQFRIIARAGDGTLIPWDGVTFSGQGRAIGAAAQPIPAQSQGPYYMGGVFNHLILIWPVTCDTLVKRKQAFDGTDMFVGAVLGVGTPITYPTL